MRELATPLFLPPIINTNGLAVKTPTSYTPSRDITPEPIGPDSDAPSGSPEENTPGQRTNTASGSAAKNSAKSGTKNGAAASPVSAGDASTAESAGLSTDSTSTPEEDKRIHICFVCTGNICRSPMAEIIVHDEMETEMLDLVARTSSCGLGGWHVGQGADERAISVLRKSGHDGGSHRAAKIGPEHMEADLLIAMDTGHRDALLKMGIDKHRVRLMRSFDPNAPEDASIEDPYYGTEEDFVVSREQIEAATPGILAWIRNQAKG